MHTEERWGRGNADLRLRHPTLFKEVMRLFVSPKRLCSKCDVTCVFVCVLLLLLLRPRESQDRALPPRHHCVLLQLNMKCPPKLMYHLGMLFWEAVTRRWS